MKMKRLNKNALAWVRALESGRYKQAKGTLSVREGRNLTHCCLGVACRLYIKAGNKLAVNEYSEIEYIDSSGESNGSTLPCDVKEWLGLKDDTGAFGGEQLSAMNDNGIPFLEIAKIIRSQPTGLFK